MKPLKDRLLQILSGFKRIPRCLRLVFSVTGSKSFLWFSCLLALGLIPAGIALLSKEVVDNLNSSVVPSAITLGILLLLSELLLSASKWLRAQNIELLNAELADSALKKSAEVDLNFYDSPEYYDHLYRAQTEASSRPALILSATGGLVRNSIALLSFAVILFPYGWWVTAALVGSLLPTLWVVLNLSARHFEWHKEVTTTERRKRYFEWLLSDREPAAELRSYQLKEKFLNNFSNLRSVISDKRLKLTARDSLEEAIAALLTLSITITLLTLWFTKTINGSATLGSLVLLYQVFRQGQSVLRSLLSDVASLLKSSLFLEEYFSFLDLKPSITNSSNNSFPLCGFQSIQLQNISFSYPGGNHRVLEDVSLSIPENKIVALVGPNGSGKTTLAKLLCRLYDVDSGTIHFGTTEIKEINIEELRKNVSVMFQQPVHYNASLNSNITLHDSVVPSVNHRDSGVDTLVNKLPQREKTVLGKWFDSGTELSVGEWQKIALARALHKPAPILILDEPTSALDPWAEQEWFEQISPALKGRTVLIITHRLTTAMHANLIYVLKSGRVIESGSHNELLAADSEYARAWGRPSKLKEAV